MNKPLRNVVIAMLGLFVVLIGNITYVQYVDADSLRNNPSNARVLLSEYDHPRGNITAGTRTIATSKATNDRLKYLRTYPEGQIFSPVTGIYSLVYGATGLEHAENDVLAGTDDRLALSRLSDLFTGRTPKGGNVVTTIDPKAQQVAYQAMAKQKGAVVALDPRTGAILTMMSRPSFDPNRLTSHDPPEIRKSYKQLLNSPEDPLLNRAISQTYPPGSVFKTVIATAALKAGKQPDQRIPAPTTLQLPESTHVLHNFGGESCGDGRTDTLIDALTISCNTAFAQLGMNLGDQTIREQASEFGIDDKGFQMPLTVAGSSVGDMPSQAAVALSSIGQQDVRITPMQGAMIAAAVANQGTLMQPYLVKQIQASNFSVVDTTDPKVMSQPMSPDIAQQLTTMMQSVVDRGTGTAAQIPGVKVAGKTGTADNAPGKPPHAWFIGFAPANDPTVAVAVLIEHGGVAGNETTGGQAAGPVAKAVMQAILADQGGH